MIYDGRTLPWRQQQMVNINIELPDNLHKRLKLASVLEEKTIKELVGEFLSED